MKNEGFEFMKLKDIDGIDELRKGARKIERERERKKNEKIRKLEGLPTDASSAATVPDLTFYLGIQNWLWIESPTDIH